MNKGFIAQASTNIPARLEKVWQALVDPSAIKRYMFGTTVVTSWREPDYLERPVAG